MQSPNAAEEREFPRGRLGAARPNHREDGISERHGRLPPAGNQPRCATLLHLVRAKLESPGAQSVSVIPAQQTFRSDRSDGRMALPDRLLTIAVYRDPADMLTR